MSKTTILALIFSGSLLVIVAILGALSQNLEFAIFSLTLIFGPAAVMAIITGSLDASPTLLQLAAVFTVATITLVTILSLKNIEAAIGLASLAGSIFASILLLFDKEKDKNKRLATMLSFTVVLMLEAGSMGGVISVLTT